MTLEIHGKNDRARHWPVIGRNDASGVNENSSAIPIGDRDDRLHLLLDAVREYAVFLLDAEGRIASWNSGAERIKGYSAEEVIGKCFSMFYRIDDIRAGKPARHLSAAKRYGRVEEEGWRVRKDGSTFWAGTVITALRDSGGAVCGFAKVTHDLSERKAVEEALQRSMQQLQSEVQQRIEAEISVRELSARLLHLQDEERKRLGQELHDGVGQLLSGIKMAVVGLGSKAGKTAFARQLADCSRLIEEAITEVRTMSYLLYPPMLEELGLKSAAEWYVDGFRERSGIRVTFEADGDIGRLPRDGELVLFRVLQECLTNVHRHSGSATAFVRLKRETDVAVLEVRDEGKGTHVKGAPGGDDSPKCFGVGLRGMKERVRQLGGTLDLISNADGMEVRATIPAANTSGWSKQAVCYCRAEGAT